MLKIEKIKSIYKKNDRYIIDFGQGDVIRVKNKRTILPLLMLIKYTTIRVCDFQNERYDEICNILYDKVDDKTIFRNEYVDKYKPFNDLINEEKFAFIKKEAHSKEKTYILDVKDYKKLLKDRVDNKVDNSILKKQNGLCNICFKPIKSEEGVVGYIKPISRGGCEDKSNMEILCKDCYAKKREKCRQCIEICALKTCPLNQLDIDNIPAQYISSLQIKVKAKKE